MKPRQPEPAKSDDLFRSRLDSIINPRHELVQLANRIDWTYLDGQVEPFFAVEGRPAIPSRLMVGLHLLKHMHQLSDEAVCARWVENPYYQYFCGEAYFQHQFPIQRSSMTHWRKRVGEVFFETLIQESLRIAFDSKALKRNQLKRVVVDTPQYSLKPSPSPPIYNCTTRQSVPWCHWPSNTKSRCVKATYGCARRLLSCLGVTGMPNS